MALTLAIYVTGLLAVCHCYTLKSGVDVVFPVQLNVDYNDDLFKRINSEKMEEILACPRGFTFNHDEMKCEYLYPDIEFTLNDLCPPDLNGIVPDPHNCRNFINCYYGNGHVQTCGAHLLFSKAANNCEWPETSECCEYMENTSGFDSS